MKKLHLFWKIVLILLTSSAIIITGFIAYSTYDNHFGYYYDDPEFSDKFTKLCCANSKFILQDKLSGKKTTPRLDWVSNPGSTDTLIVFSRNGKRGYININTGRIVIPEQYEHAWNFSEGIGAVVLNGKVGFINKDMQFEIPCKFLYFRDKDKAVDFIFKDGLCPVFNVNGKQGLINKKGEWVLNPTYDYINKAVNGYRIVKQNNNYGLLDKDLQLTLPAVYNNIEIQQNGIRIATKGEQKLLSWDMQTVLHPFVYDQIKHLQYNTGEINDSGEEIFNNTNCFAYRISSKWGLMDKNGKVMTKAVYDDIKAITGNLFCCTTENYKLTVNSRGEIIY